MDTRNVDPLPTHLSGDFAHLSSCRDIDQCYERLNKIEEGTYGIVYRARDLHTNEIVALKHLKLTQERNGFPITSLREIHTLLLAKHPTSSMCGRSPFQPSEVKSLMLQLCSARLKTSNLLMANGGALRVADFGLARKYSSPLGHMTGLVVTLWYRAPELLLGAKGYSTAVDMWSLGCIFAELFVHKPFWQGRGEIDQIGKIFAAIGVPTQESWPGFDSLPNAKMFRFSQRPDSDSQYGLTSRLRGCAGVTGSALDLMRRMLTLDPRQRITAEEAINHPYFAEVPPPKHPSMFPTWPSKASS
ncbi:kinase-like domain-containing protein [Kickxella alabastrina]|uniref:kinase-like domain-containing protein n=1 Tax=Kickxella alabastrina TaxID=61397 RepID=UPI002220E7B5|nr:kinase-like domain-containing protein [Kickxella alabastrina]KAI7827720.1 kinase-like domain-containing protein [Kickxella alabastrina]